MADVNPKMPLIQFPFSAGIDEATRDEVVEAGAGWLVLENGRQDKRGGYSTRPGFTALTNTSYAAASPTSGYKMFSDRDALTRIADNEAQVYSSASTRWQSLGRAPEVGCRLIDMPSLGAASGHIDDIATVNGYVALAWAGSSAGSWSAVLAIVDEATGATVRAPEIVGSSTSAFGPTLAIQGSAFIMVRPNTANTEAEAWYLDTTSAATINTGWVAFGASLCTDLDNGRVELHSLTSTSRVAMIYRNTSGGVSRLTLKYFTTAGVIATQTIDTNSTSPTLWTLGGKSSDTCWLAWNEGTSVCARGQDPTTVSTTLATKATIMTMSVGCLGLQIIGSETASGKARIVALDDAATIQSMMRGVQTTAGAAATDGSQITVPRARAVRRGFHYGGRYYGMFTGGVSQDVLVLCDFTSDVTYLRPVANPAPGLSAFGTSASERGRAAVGSSGSKIYYGFEVKRSGVAYGSVLAAIDFNAPSRWQSAALGNSTFLTGGIPSYSDGVRIAEVGFVIRPDTPTTATSLTGITAVTGWRYVCVYEEVDADGNWHQSGLSSPSASTGAVADKTVTVTTSPLSISARMGTAAARSVRVAFYRTRDGGVAPYYRLGTTINDTAAATVTYADTTSDATLAANAKLYSQPGVLGTAQDKRPPPSFQCLASYNGMLVGASGSDVWFSGQNVTGEGVWFNPIFQVPVPGEGDITALWVQDGTLYVAKRREIFAMSGEAPSDNGAGGLGLPRRLSVDVGCIESRSVCTSALGTFFQSERGVEIFSRAQSVEWIGESVQTTLAAYPIVTSATVDPRSNCVLIELAASEASGLVTGNGRTLVYDLALRAWVSTDRRKNSAGTADTPSQSGCMIYTGTVWRYAWLGSNGRVYHENSASYVDADGTFVAKRAISANVKAAGMQGLQHINRTLVLAKYHTPHDLNLSFAYDYNSTFQTARLYTNAELVTLTGSLPNMQLEHGMHDDARCQAVRVQLQDVTPSTGTLGTGQGATWVSLCFEVVPQSGAYQLPDASR